MPLKKLKDHPKLWIVLTIVWMIVIFVLSSNHFSSQRTTAKINTPFPLRTLAHLFVYFVLGFLISGTIRLHFTWKHQLIFAFLFCVLYAFSDESHQFFETERQFRLADIATDSVGALAGIVFYYWPFSRWVK